MIEVDGERMWKKRMKICRKVHEKGARKLKFRL
jgi:hypothetical protein